MKCSNRCFLVGTQRDFKKQNSDPVKVCVCVCVFLKGFTVFGLFSGISPFGDS